MKKYPKIFVLFTTVFGLMSFGDAFGQAPPATAPLAVAEAEDSVPPPIEAPPAPMAAAPFVPGLPQNPVMPVPDNINRPENTNAQANPSAPVDPNAAVAAVAPIVDMTVPFQGSLFFSDNEVNIIREAILGNFREDVDMPTSGVDGVPVPLANPLISVSGVLYRGPGNWVVWMNGQKVTPGNLLPELVDIDVQSSSYVRFKWYDSTRQKLATITLRPHQTYDISTDVTWPGTQ